MVYLLCLRLSCLALGLPTPSEVHAELDKRAMLKTLSKVVRDTLVSRQYLPLLHEGQKVRVSSGSLSSWDGPLGLLERKREVQLDKRSYSDSDLSRITVNEVRFLQKISHACVNFNCPENSASLYCILLLRTWI